ncbi:MAG: hypothetical protein MUE82_05230 [Chloroflexi bacterium]|nr:hypothetical protein [Chloroflexota bacterium]
MSALPAPVERFRALLADQPDIETVRIETTAWMRRPGMPPIPLEITMAHRLGQAFVHDIRIGRRPVAFRFGLDAFVDGHGVVRIGPAVSRGTNYDQGALIAMWGEALGFRSAWEGRDDVRWEPVDDDTAILAVAGPQGELPITVAFHPVTGLPRSCTADRHKGDGPRVSWTGTTTGWRRIDGVLVPGRFTAQWADEDAPWIEITTRHVRTNVPVDGTIALGRRLLAPRRPGLRHALTDFLGGIPYFVVTPFVRRWHLRWGATAAEVAASMPGDGLVRRAQFVATRAITIDAPPDRVWPWIRQIGFRRAGFYAYDLLDNLGHPSATEIVEELQDLKVGDWIAMAEPVNEVTAFRVESFEEPSWMVWRKPDSTWAWRLEPLDAGRTRLVTRLACRYELDRPASAAVSMVLMELGDFPMMRHLLRGLKARAERTK